MFDHDKVRFSSVSSLAEDILSLSHRRADILVGYLGIDSLPETNGAVPKSPCQDNSENPDVSEQHEVVDLIEQVTSDQSVWLY